MEEVCKFSSSEVSFIIREQLKKRRKQLDFTFKDMAERMNLGLSTVKGYESGQNNISAVRLYALSKVLNVHIEYFFNKEDEISCKDRIIDPKVVTRCPCDKFTYVGYKEDIANS